MGQFWEMELSLVHLAAGIQVIGFLIRDHLLLRALILIGTILYIIYYYIEPETPLWDAMICGALMGMANLYTMVCLALDRRPARFDEDDLEVYRAIPHVTPGEFKRLVAIGNRATVTAPTVITREGEMPDHLYYLISGTFTLDKKTGTQHLAAPSFLGEIAYMLDRPASASVTLDPGARYIRWKVTRLKSLMARQTLLQNALSTALNHDMAVKVANAR